MAADVGQNQMWVSQYFRFTNPRCFLSSGGLGTMGYALPAAIGARVGNPDREVLMVAGDGGFQMNIQELATIKKHNLLLKMVVLDNGYLGMVRQWQELLCQKRYSGTDMYGNPDFRGHCPGLRYQGIDDFPSRRMRSGRGRTGPLLRKHAPACENRSQRKRLSDGTAGRILEQDDHQ